MTEPKPQPEIRVRIDAELRVEVQFDIIRYFKEFTPDARRREWYWGMDLSEWGFDSEFERPIAWLTREVSEAYDPTGMGGYPKGHPIQDHTGGLDFSGERIEERNGVRAGHKDQYWTEADFEALIAAVPWLGRPPEAAPEVASTTPPMFTVGS